MKKEDYINWVNDAYQYIEKVYPIVSKLENVNVGSTQYIPKIEGDFELVFLGHDAHEGRADGSPMDITNAKNRFYKGNSDPICWRKQKEWKIWNNIESAFRNIGFNEIMDNGYISDEILNKTIVTNALLFNYTGKANELNDCLKKDIVNDCMKLAGKLIFDVIKPKMVICSSCSLVFEPLIKNFNTEINYEIITLYGTNKKVMRCQFNDVIVVGIPHTSYPVPRSVAAFVRDSYLGKEIGYTISNISLLQNNTVLKKYSINHEHIIELVTSSKKFQLNKIENASERYKLSDHLMLTITKTGKGYLAIRHINYDGKYHYPNSKYKLTKEYRDILFQRGWDCNSPFWIATRPFKEFGNNDDKIAENIIAEINEIVNILKS